MRNTIILFHPQTNHEKNYRFFWIPYSVLSIGSELSESGYNVRIIDENIQQVNYSDLNIDFTSVLLVGVSVMIGNQITSGLSFSKYIKSQADIPIVWGGPFPTLLPKLSLESEFVDYIIRGPGEKAIVDLANFLQKGQIFPDKVIGHKMNNHMVLGEIQRFNSHTEYARFNYNLIDVKKYVRNDSDISDKVINYISSRGCCYGCGFCTEVAVYNHNWTAFQPQRVISETDWLMSLSGANAIKFYDANFFVDKYRAIDTAVGIHSIRDNFSFAASAHPNNILSLTNSELSILKKNGLKRLLIGLESGVQEELDFIYKGIDIQQIPDLIKRLEDNGIIGSFTFIVGYPTMPLSNIQRTLDFVEKLASKTTIHEFKTHFYLPYPGTPFFELAKQCGFQEPRTLIEWAYYDYYQAQMPWVDNEFQKKVDNLNKNLCPYVQI